MPNLRLPAVLLTAMLLKALPATAAEPHCGGPFPTFVDGLRQEALAKGHAPAVVDSFLAGVRADPKVLKADRSQGVFRLDFLSFSRRVISADRLNRGAEMSRRHSTLFDRIEAKTGVPRGILLAFWALETDFGAVQGDYNTRNALVTLAHDCRRPALFRPQVFAALDLYERGDFDPAHTTGAWAGEIGQMQMLPGDILAEGQDGDGDGHVRPKTSAADALMTAAVKLRALGWRPQEPWLQEVTVPGDFDWFRSGLKTAVLGRDWQAAGITPRNGTIPAELPAALLLPMGRHGPAFLAYPNFRQLFGWNQSFVYVTTAAYFATRLEGAPVYRAGNPDPGLDGKQMAELQTLLTARGYDVGAADGILGAKTRQAVQLEQQAQGLPADAWPDPRLLERLRR